MNKITLSIDTVSHCWMADFHGDMEIIKTFGTTTIPTAFTDKAAPARVLAAIQKLNPGADVVLA